MYKTKECGLEIKDLDLSKRTVTGYFAAFGNVDSDGDVIEKGAFAKSIKENGPDSQNPRIAHLLQHNIYEPIGKIKELYEDEKGLRFVSQLSESTKGRDSLILYQEGIFKEHSIGFNTVKSEAKDDYNSITEVKLWEGSTVTFGANPQTPVVSIKGQNKEDALNQVNERMVKLANVIRKAEKLSDEAFENLAIELEQLKTLYNSLIEPEPRESTLDKIEPGFVIEGFTNTFKLN